MRNHIYKVIAIIGIFAGFAAVNVQGQTASRVEVEIPFEFSAGKTKLKPGTYSIKRLSGDLLSLRRDGSESSVILNAPVTGSSHGEEGLVFNKYGEQYSLTQIWLSADSGREVLTPGKSGKHERIELSLRRR